MNYAEFASILNTAPDADQKEVICSLQNTIVSAGAGSGKTQTLASRFAYLITADLKDKDGNTIKNPTVERILTLTFTKKAAAEMYQRIYLTLKRFAQNAKDPAAKQKAQDAIDNFSKARIQTLDSYSASILRQAAPLYGIRPDFTPGANPSQINDLAFDFVMDNRWNPAIQWISDPAKIEDCAKLFADAANKNASIASSANKEKKCAVFAQSLAAQKEFAQEQWNKKRPFIAIEKAIQEANQYVPYDKLNKRPPQWLLNLVKAYDFWEQEKTQKARAAFRALAERKDLYQDLDKTTDLLNSNDFILLKNAIDAFNVSRVSDDNIKETLISRLFKKESEDTGITTDFYNILNFLSDLKRLERLHPLLDEFTDKAIDYKRKAGELTFKDTNDLALLALKEQESIRIQERDSYDFIMIDEFQDNNGPNRDLLLLISKDDDGNIMKNRLFFVGDEKQSIYRFRGADVSVFNSLEESIKPCAKLPMRINYRSSNLLLDEFNQFFGGFFPTDKSEPTVKEECAKLFKNGGVQVYEAKYDQNARAVFPEKKEADTSPCPRMHVCSYPSEEQDPDDYIEEKNAKALFIAKKILELHQEKGVAFRDIALLTRSRTNYSNIARIFTLNKVPFALDEQADILTQATTNDFYSVLRLCVYPADINAFASFLNSPFAGMTLNAAEKILSLFPSKAFDPEIDAKSVLSKEELERYKAAENFYKEMSDFALSNPIANSIERLWQKEGYKFSLNADEELYDLLYELARKADLDAKDLSWFVDQLAIESSASFGEHSEIDLKEIDYPVESSDSVNIMTIHKSKGLQFKYVFVWGLSDTREGNNSDNSKILQSEKFGAVVAASNKKDNFFVLMAADEEKKKEDAEKRRLAYVALTRAKEELFIVGNEPPKNPTARPVPGIIQFYQDNDIYDAPFDVIHIEPYPRGSERPASSGKELTVQDIKKIYGEAKEIQTEKAKNIWTSPSALEAAADPASADPSITQSASLAYPEINSFVNATALAKNDYGTLFHAFMEGWARDYKNWTQEKIAAEEYFEWESKVQKLSLENRKILLKTFFKILDKFLGVKDNPAYDALKNGRSYRAEYEFKTKIKSFIIRGTMDAVFQNSDGTWTVLDYKTDLAPNPQIYYNQLACYKKTAADLFAGGDQNKVRCVLFFAESNQFVDISQEAQKALEGLSDEKIRNLIEKQQIL